MLELVRWLAALAGLALIVVVWRSVITTIILPRSNASRLTVAIWIGVRRAFMAVVKRRADYHGKDQVLALLGPVFLLTMLATWIALFLLGFALIFWRIDGASLGHALSLAGSSLFTLGFTAISHGPSAALAFIAAATGMVIVALQIGYLPSLYGAYNRRETLVTALQARAGAPAWGPEVLARHQLNQTLATLPALFAAWENWAADIAESHTSYPWLILFRSPEPLNNWVISLLAVLDAAALYNALSPGLAPPETRQCLRSGYVALRAIARIAGHPVNEDPHPDDPIHLSYERFEFGVGQLVATGFPSQRTAEEAWPHFRGWRVNYEDAAEFLASFIVAPPAPWSGMRRYLTKEQAIDVLVNRPRHRSPDDPEGWTAFPFVPQPQAAPEAEPTTPAAAAAPTPGWQPD